MELLVTYSLNTWIGSTETDKMPWPFTSVDALCEEVGGIVDDSGKRVAVESRNAFADQFLGSLLIWEIITGGTLHICEHLIAESIHAKLSGCWERLRRKDQKAIADAKELI